MFWCRFELLEHTLFWFLSLFTWLVFIRLGSKEGNQGLLYDDKYLDLDYSVLLVFTTSFQYLAIMKISFS